MKWQQKLINRVKEINFQQDNEVIKETFKNLCEDFKDCKNIIVNEELLSITVKAIGFDLEYIFQINPRNISVVTNIPIYGVACSCCLDSINKIYYDLGTEQTEHKEIEENINYEEILNKLMNFLVK